MDVTPLLTAQSFSELRQAASDLGLERDLRSLSMQRVFGRLQRQDVVLALATIEATAQDASLDALLRRGDFLLQSRTYKGARKKLLKTAAQALVVHLRKVGKDRAPPVADTEAWARENGVGDWLDRSIEEAVDEHGRRICGWPYGRKIRDALSGKEPGSRPSEADDLRVFLRRIAEERRQALVEEATAGLMDRPLPEAPAFARAVERLRSLRARIRDLVAPRPRKRVELESMVVVDSNPIELKVTERRPSHLIGPMTVETTVPLTVDVEPSPTCSECRRLCEHILFAVDQALALLLLTSPDDPTVLFVKERLGQPGWRRALMVLDGTIEKLAKPATHEDPRLWWCFDPEELTLLPYLQSRGKRGKLKKPQKRSVWSMPDEALADPRDRAVLACARLLQKARNRGEAEVAFIDGVRALAGHPRAVAFEIADEPWRVETGTFQLAAVASDGGTELRPVLLGAPLSWEDFVAKIDEWPFDDRSLLFDDAERLCAIVHVSDELFRLCQGLRMFGADKVPDEARPELFDRLARLSAHVPVTFPEEESGLLPAQIEPVLVLQSGQGDALEVSIRVRPIEGGALHVPGEGTPTAVASTSDRDVMMVRRDFGGEVQAATGVARRLGLAPDETWQVEVEEPARVAALLRALREDPVECRWPGGSLRPRVLALGALKMQVREVRDWFGLEGGIEVDGHRVSLAVLLQAARHQRSFVKVGEGMLALLEESLVERLKAVEPLTFTKKDRVEVSPAAAMVLDDVEAPDAWSELRRRIQRAGDITPEVPSALQAELRDYQVAGHRWMTRISAWSAGGVLADDMGLGKTVQTIAALIDRAATGPQIVVAPTSVCFNWIREMERFAPTLRPVPYFGSERKSLLEALSAGDVLITSYALLTRDIEAFASLSFGTLVLDEAQAVKNPVARRSKAVRNLDAEWRIALTGTPVENRLGELWSIFRIVFPGLLGSWEHFRERFVNPIERDGFEEARRALASVIRPFILRRTKAQVAKELPPRTEITIDVALSAKERALYEDVRLSSIAHLAKVKTELPAEQIRFHVLGALTRLRQLACHPKLYDETSTVPSSKLERLMHLVKDLVEEERRALVFSQFTSNLALVREALDEAGIPYVSLDGSTPAAERSSLVDRFQSQEIPIFLLSLKAGGTGLNLTAADTVIHLDPWWNPAVEDQATDRAHRIGQTDPVTVIRLVARGTIEEQILALHDDKRHLVADLLEGTDRAGALSSDDLMKMIEAGFTGSYVEEGAPAPPAECSFEAVIRREVAEGQLKASTAGAYQRVAKRIRELGATTPEHAVSGYLAAIAAGRYPKSDQPLVQPVVKRMFPAAQ